MTLRKMTFSLLFFVFIAPLLAQNSQAYRLQIEAPIISDTVLYLGRYHGHKTYLVDTAYRDKQASVFVFEGSESLPEGLYLLANNRMQNLMDMVISEQSHHFTIKVNKAFDVRNVKFVGSKENKRLQAYLSLSAKHYEKSKLWRERLPILKAKDSDSVALIQAQIDKMSAKEYKMRQAIIRKAEGTVVADLMHLLNNVEADENLRLQYTNAKAEVDSVAWYYGRQKHYWDAIDLKSDRVLYNPFIGRRIDDYFDNYVLFEVDSVNVAIDDFMGRLRKGGNMYVYALWYLLNKYEQSQVMGQDAVLVHMADTYFKDSIPGVHPIIADNIVKKAEARRAILIGAKAPNIIGKDTSSTERSLYNLQGDFTIVAFWNPSCSHCREEMPALLSYFHQHKETYNLSVMGVCTSPDPVSFSAKSREWQIDFCNVLPITERFAETACNFKETYQVDATPALYLLDKDKNIIAKHFGVEHIDLLIKHYQKQKTK